jgi:Putative Ig domain
MKLGRSLFVSAVTCCALSLVLVIFPQSQQAMASKSEVLTIAPASIASATVGQPYIQLVAATGGISPYSWSVASGALPEGLNLTPAGLISGVPQAAGAWSFKAKVLDSSSPPLSANRKYQLDIALSLGPESLPAATAGTTYSQALSATGGTAPYSWTVISGAIPKGLNLSAKGAISGTPTKASTSKFVVRVVDSSIPSLTSTAAYSLTVGLGTNPTGLARGTVGDAYSQALTAIGGTAPYTWQVTSGSLPVGLTLSSSGLISGTPAQAESASVTIGVSDASAKARTGSGVFAMSIYGSLSIPSQSLTTARVGTIYSDQLQSNGGQGAVAWSLSSGGLPPGMSLSASGLLSGTPTGFGYFAFVAEAQDSSSPPQTATVSLRLLATSSELAVGQSLSAGSSLWSPSNLYHADMQSDGNLVVYPAGKTSSTLGAIWSTGTGDPGDYVTLQIDGNMVIYPAGDNNSTGGALWNASTWGNSGDYLKMQDDGNLVVYSEGGLALWSSDSGKLNESTSVLQDGDSMGAGQSLWSPSNLYHADMQSDGNLVVYPAGKTSSTLGAIWSTGTGDPGDYVTLQTDGNMVIYPAGDNNSTGGALWNASTWGNSGDYLKVQDDGNLVVYSSSGEALWSSMGGKVTGGQGSAADQVAVSWSESFLPGHPNAAPASEWNEMCLGFVDQAFLQGGIDITQFATNARNDPIDFWDTWNGGGTRSGPTAKPPYGALVFWGPNPPYDNDGHVAISLGDGTVVTSEAANLGSGVHVAPISTISAGGAPYLGWLYVG